MAYKGAKFQTALTQCQNEKILRSFGLLSSEHHHQESAPPSSSDINTATNLEQFLTIPIVWTAVNRVSKMIETIQSFRDHYNILQNQPPESISLYEDMARFSLSGGVEGIRQMRTLLDEDLFAAAERRAVLVNFKLQKMWNGLEESVKDLGWDAVQAHILDSTFGGGASTWVDRFWRDFRRNSGIVDRSRTARQLEQSMSLEGVGGGGGLLGGGERGAVSCAGAIVCYVVHLFVYVEDENHDWCRCGPRYLGFSEPPGGRRETPGRWSKQVWERCGNGHNPSEGGFWSSPGRRFGNTRGNWRGCNGATNWSPV